MGYWSKLPKINIIKSVTNEKRGEKRDLLRLCEESGIRCLEFTFLE